MRYYPLSQVVTGSKTDGTEFLVEGVPYMGPYYKTSDGKYYTGNNPVTGQSRLMTPATPQVSGIDEPLPGGYMPGYSILLGNNNDDYINTKNIDINNYRNFLEIVPYYVKPTEQDYSRGYIMRYFAKKRNENGNIIEIDKKVYLSLQKADSPYDYTVNHAIDTYWQLTGPLKDTVSTQTGIRTKGIVDNNKRLIEAKEPIFKGLTTYIGGKYDKFSRPDQL